jgi:CubicO group peptidase (beta-lactamase class C family)
MNNIARAYTVFSDGSSVERPLPSLQGGDAFDASGSIRSCVKDMLIWCKTLIFASKIPAHTKEEAIEVVPAVLFESTEPLSRHNLLKAMRAIQQPQIRLSLDPSQSYALGLYSFRLPTKEINAVTNAPDVIGSYNLGAESAPRAVIGHNSDLGGFTSAYWTFPETESAVVVMTNASSVDGDPTNIVAQTLTQALFDLTPEVDFVDIAAQATAAAKSRWQSTVHS